MAWKEIYPEEQRTEKPGDKEKKRGPSVHGRYIKKEKPKRKSEREKREGT